MSVQVDERAESIGHLSFEIVCESDRHEGDRTRADWWVYCHGCAERLTCNTCYQRWRTEWGEARERRGFNICVGCDQRFDSVDEAHVARPLRLS